MFPIVGVTYHDCCAQFFYLDGDDKGGGGDDPKEGGGGSRATLKMLTRAMKREDYPSGVLLMQQARAPLWVSKAGAVFRSTSLMKLSGVLSAWASCHRGYPLRKLSSYAHLS